MKTINLLTKGTNAICYIQNNNKINYTLYRNVLDEIHKLCFSYNEININEKDIRISNSELKLIIENYKNNTNVVIDPFIKKLQKDYRELKIKKLRKQKIKRISVFSCVILISGGILVNTLSNDNIIKGINEYNDFEINSMITSKKDNQEQIIDFVVAETKNIKIDNNLVYVQNTNNTKDFSISFETRVDSDKFQITKAYYSEIITKISNEYGIDPRIMLAIATQESGIHNPDLRGPAIGLMQIERAIWNGQSITAYNYEKCANETLNITTENLKDLDFNIRVSCMIFKECLKNSRYNLPVAIQMYNYGYGNINKTFKSAYGNNINFKEICEDCDNSWLEYRENIPAGDNQYLEHIFSYIEDLEDIQIKNGEEVIKYNILNKVKTF